MPVLEKLSEYCLKKGDEKKTDFTENPKVLAELNNVREEIARALEDTEYFHGTGRKSYAFKGDSQYDGIDHHVEVDRLEKLVKEGLKPQEDLFAENFTGDEDAKTVSLSKNRMYSRIYADLHMNENEDYQYEYGSQKFWWYYMLYLMFIAGITDKNEWKSKYANARSKYKLVWNANMNQFKELAVKGKNIPGFFYVCNAFLFILQYFYFQKDALWKAEKIKRPNKKDRNAEEWIGRFRSDYGGVEKLQSPRKKATQYNKFITTGKSDIPDNYGIIIGIKKGKVKKRQIKRKVVSCLETRAQNTLDTKSWSYIETPMAVVEKTKKDLQKILDDANMGALEIPIFATEQVEMLMREKSLTELAKTDKD